jgi:phage portal protein BeeE
VNLLRSMLERNTTSAVSVTDWAKMFRPGAQVVYNGRQHQAFQTAGAGAPGGGHYQSNSIVFACEAKRIKVFSEARFQFQTLRSGREGDLFGTQSLSLLEEPWPGATTRDLLAMSELDVMMSGNSYWVRDGGGFLLRLDPANVRIVTEAIVDEVSGFRVGERLLGYAYVTDRKDFTYYAPRDIAHYKPVPSPNQFLGQSWLSPCLPDVDADAQMTAHKQSSLRNGTRLDYVVTFEKEVGPETFERFVAQFKDEHEGVDNAGKTVFIGAGADIKTVGQTFENLALKATQGAGETRVAACAGTPPVLVGLSEGLQGSSLNAGNYGAAKRSFVDSEMRPAWGAFAASFQWLVDLPPARTGEINRLWYDDRGIAFLREDVKDQAEILLINAQILRTLTDGGWKPDGALGAVKAGDLVGLFGQHSGLYSVQLQEPGATTPPTKEITP